MTNNIDDLEAGKFTLEDWQVCVNTEISMWVWTWVGALTRDDLEKMKFTDNGKVRIFIHAD